MKNFTRFIKENYDNQQIIDDQYFIKRVPFFKTFENNSGGDTVRFNHYKIWKGSDERLVLGDDIIEFSDISIETKFIYYPLRKRDFESEEKLNVFRPLIVTEHHFIYSTDIKINFPDDDITIDAAKGQVVALIINEMIKNDVKLKESFEVKEGETIPKNKLDSIFNSINRNLFKIEETTEKMNLSNYF